MFLFVVVTKESCAMRRGATLREKANERALVPRLARLAVATDGKRDGSDVVTDEDKTRAKAAKGSHSNDEEMKKEE